MRKALNENQTVQIIVIAALMLGAGLLVMTQMGGGGGGSSSPTDPSASSPATGATTPPSTAVPTSVPPTAPATPQPAQTVSPLVPGPGLPQKVMVDYSDGKTIVLLVVRAGGIDDRLVKGAVERLKADPRLAVFVTRAEGIARYSRITQGVGVSQVPALVVVSPRGVSGDAPKASVRYGFRSPQSILQAVRDAAYNGRDVGYDPG